MLWSNSDLIIELYVTACLKSTKIGALLWQIKLAQLNNLIHLNKTLSEARTFILIYKVYILCSHLAFIKKEVPVICLWWDFVACVIRVPHPALLRNTKKEIENC